MGTKPRPHPLPVCPRAYRRARPRRDLQKAAATAAEVRRQGQRPLAGTAAAVATALERAAAGGVTTVGTVAMGGNSGRGCDGVGEGGDRGHLDSGADDHGRAEWPIGVGCRGHVVGSQHE